MDVPNFSKTIVNSIVTKTFSRKSPIRNIRIIDFISLYKLLDEEEITLIKDLLKINPLQYGFKGDYLKIGNVPKNIVELKNQKFVLNGKRYTIAKQYLPKPVYNTYVKMNSVLFLDTGKKLNVDSGYRSPAYQTILFLYYLQFHKFNFKRVIRAVAIPGYSEHGNPKMQAIDFITSKGVPTDGQPFRFEKTDEYKWLIENANKYGFVLSYPKDNDKGIMFEPWHWRFQK